MKSYLREVIGKYTKKRQWWEFAIYDDDINFQLEVEWFFRQHERKINWNFTVRDLNSKWTINTRVISQANKELEKFITTSIWRHTDVDVSWPKKIILHLVDLFFI